MYFLLSNKAKMLVCYLFYTQLHHLKLQSMHELSIYSQAALYCINKNTTSPEADGKWLESPRNKTSIGNFPELKDVYNSCSAKYRIATPETEDIYS